MTTYTIATSADVFEFMGPETKVRTEHASGMNSLIQEVCAEVESLLGRYIQPVTITNELLMDKFNCRIIGQKLFLLGKLRDMYSISSIVEDSTTLHPVSGADSGDYYLKSGMIYKLDESWSKEPFDIKISGSCGINDDGSVKKDVKRIVIEMCAAKSGLWKKVIATDQGVMNIDMSYVSSDVKDLIKKLKLKDV